MFLIAVVLFRPDRADALALVAERRAAGEDARGDVRTIVRMAVALTVVATGA